MHSLSFREVHRLLIGITLLLVHEVHSQTLFEGKEHLFTSPQTYFIYKTNEKVNVDGIAEEAVWQHIPWSSDFVDIEGNLKPKPSFRTRFKMTWDSQQLYIYAELEEPHLWGTLTRYDDIIYHDNDFEIFIDPDGDAHHYFEIEVNILKTIFDLYMNKPYRNRGKANISWNAKDVHTGVAIDGTLNNPDDVDSKWTLEMSIPFSSLTMNDIRTPIPQPYTIWRMNFSRVEWNRNIINHEYVRKRDSFQKLLPENNWVWSEQGVINMHFPERWGYVIFSDKTIPTNEEFTLPYSEMLKKYLWLIYYKQKDYFIQHKHYADNLNSLGLPSDTIRIQEQSCRLIMNASDSSFIVEIISETPNEHWQLNEEGLVAKK